MSDDVAGIKQRISQLSTVRSHFWRIGNTTAASECSAELEGLWQAFRQARATDETEPEHDEQEQEPIDDPVDRFLVERCERHETAATTVREVYAAFTRWAEHEQEEGITTKRLTIELRQRGIQSVLCRPGPAQRYVGLTVSDFPHSPSSDSD